MARMLHLDDHILMTNLRISERLAYILHESARHARCIETGQPVRLRVVGQPRIDQLIQFFAVHDPLVIGCKTGLVQDGLDSDRREDSYGISTSVATASSLSISPTAFAPLNQLDWLGQIKSEAGFAKIAGVELNLLDAVRYFHKAAGINGVAQIVKDLGATADPRKLAKAAAQYENASVCRLGYLLCSTKPTKFVRPTRWNPLLAEPNL